MRKLRFMLIALVVMVGLNSCSNNCGHNFIEHDYANDLVGTWSIIGPDHADALVIKADGTMEYTGVDNGEFYEGTARYEVVDNRMTIFWDDGTIDEGRLSVVPGSAFLMTIDEETGAAYYFTYCYEDFSDKIVCSWMVQSDITSEVHGYYEDGITDCLAYYYHLDEPYETYITGTYKVIGDILFETATYGEDMVYSFASRISFTPGTPLGDVMTITSYTTYEDELVEEVLPVIRIKSSLDLAGKKYDYKETFVSNVMGEDKDVEFMGYTVNFAKMDGSELDKLLRALLFNIEFPDAETISYSYLHNNVKQTLSAAIEIEDNKMTIKMSDRVPTLKDVVFYTFQNHDSNQLHLCMDKTAFVNFHTNMQAILIESQDEQFDITNAEAVDAIHKSIDDAVETIKVSFVMTRDAK